jgi:hypothetical protein
MRDERFFALIVFEINFDEMRDARCEMRDVCLYCV